MAMRGYEDADESEQVKVEVIEDFRQGCVPIVDMMAAGDELGFERS